MYKIKHALNAHEFPKKHESSSKPSMTIPDQSLSIRELYDRFQSGLPLQGVKDAVYYGEDDDFPDLAKMDLADRENYIKGVREELEEFKTKRSAQIDAKRREKEEAAFQKRLEIELQKRAKDNAQGNKDEQQ